MDKEKVEQAGTMYLRIRLAEQVILLQVEEVELIVSIVALQEVPMADPAFEGMMNYHGSDI